MSFQDHFANASRTELGNWMKWQTKQRERVFIEKLCPDRRAIVLEIGPGKGELADLLKQAGYTNYRAVEPNPTMRDILVQRGFAVRDYFIPQIDEPDSSVDLIVLIDVFEHLNGPDDAQTFMSEAYRVLRPNGIICFGCPDYLHWREDFFNCDHSHNNVTTVRRAQQLLYGAGFEALEYAYFSTFLTGIPATLLSWFARTLLTFANSNGLDMKAYKLKLTLLRRFLIAGRRQGD